MLNRAKLLRELEHLSGDLFPSFQHEYHIALEAWKRICNDPLFREKAVSANDSWALPEWSGQLDAVIPVEFVEQGYTAVSVDGSQVYPDKHQGTSCFLINIGSVVIEYGVSVGRVIFDSQPTVFTHKEIVAGCGNSQDIVNCQRQEHELVAGYQLSTTRMYDHVPQSQPFILLFDGTLIFWHVDTKELVIKRHFFPRYCDQLYNLYENKTLTAGYISMPRSRELMGLVRFFLSDDGNNREAYKIIDHIVDSAVMQSFLKPFTRTTVFKSTTSICKEYRDVLRPHFFYLHVGDEIARVEVPAWIASDTQQLNLLATLILDQSRKGRGYPVVLAEAHEQAVVKGPDRDFFYHVIAKFGVEQKQKVMLSQKNMKKRALGI